MRTNQQYSTTTINQRLKALLMTLIMLVTQFGGITHYAAAEATPSNLAVVQQADPAVAAADQLAAAEADARKAAEVFDVNEATPGADEEAAVEIPEVGQAPETETADDLLQAAAPEADEPADDADDADADAVSDETPDEPGEEPDQVFIPEIPPMPVDQEMKVGDSYDAAITMPGGIVTVRLRVDRARTLELKATGLDVFVDIKKGENGRARRYISEDGVLLVPFDAAADPRLPQRRAGGSAGAVRRRGGCLLPDLCRRQARQPGQLCRGDFRCRRDRRSLRRRDGHRICADCCHL